jgi:hypothetical protein
VDIGVILDAAKAEAPGLRELARRFLQTEALHLGVPLDVSSVIARQAEGIPELHITGAADRLLEHLIATEPGIPATGARSWRWRASGRAR